MTRPEDMLFIWMAASSIAGLTWFFSSRPRLFIRVFVPRGEWRAAIHAFVHDRRHERSMRIMALGQFGLACVFGGIAIWLWLVM
jgi:hypothetical protein